MTERLWISRCPPIHSAKRHFGPVGSSPRVGCRGGRILESREGIFRDDQPGIRHCAQAPTWPIYRGPQLPMGNSSCQRNVYLGSGPPHQDIIGMTKDVPGIVTDVPCIATNFPGIVTDVPGVTTDLSRSLVHSLLYRNLAGCLVKTTVGSAART